MIRVKKITIKLPPVVVEPEPWKFVCLLCENEVSGWMDRTDAHDICFDCRRRARWPFTWGTLGQSDLNRICSAIEVIGVLQNGGRPPKPRGIRDWTRRQTRAS